MKYIRTKDENNLIIDMTNMQLPYNLIDGYIDFNKFGMFKIIKQANTIEELCDEFVYLTSKGKRYIEIYLSRNNGIEIINVYGAIWTEWGLKYVAKMNDKGELELL